MLREMGIGRICVNPQTFHDETLRSQLDSKGLLKLVEESIDKG